MHRLSFGAVSLILMLGSALLGTAACDRPSAGQPEATDKGVSQVRLGYFANLTHAQAVLGVASGEFAGELAPAKLETRIFNAGPSLIEAVFAGEVDIGYIGPGPAINGFEKSRGKGLRIIAGVAANGVAIVARKDADIRTLADLKNKRIATPQLGNTQDISARHYLLKTLGQTGTENVLPIPNAEQAGMMERGQIDAAWAPEPWGARLIVETGARLIGEEKDLWPHQEFTLAVIITTPEFLQKHRDVVRKMLTVHARWTERLTQQREEVLPKLGAALNELTGKKLPPGVFEQALTRTKFTNEPMEETLKLFAQWAYDVGFAKQPVDLTGLVDTSLLRELP